MDNLLIGIVIGVGAAAFFYWSIRRGKRGPAAGAATDVQSFVTSLRAVSELSVFRIRTKEIITATDHWFGEFGKRYLAWLFTSKAITVFPLMANTSGGARCWGRSRGP